VAFVASTTTRGRGPPVVDGPPNRTRALRAVVAGGGDRFRVRQRVLTDDGCKVVDRWSNGSTVLTRQRRADAPTVTDGGVGTVAGDGAGRPGGDARADTTRRSLSSVAAPTSAAAIERMLARGNYTLAAVQSGDSGRRFVLVADEYVPGPDGAVEADRVGMSARAVVDASGRVRSLQATVVRTEWSRLGTTRRVRSVSYRAVAVGVGPGTVPQPEWLAAEADGGGDATGGPATVDRQSGATGQGPVVGRAGAATCGGEAG
jgi:hypothetical protein